MNIGRTGKYYYLRLLRLRGTPHSLALGVAIGVFVGITPTIPLHTITVLALTIIARSSFLAGLIASLLVCNPLTYVPIYYLALKIGNLVTPFYLNWERVQEVLSIVLSDASFETRLKPLVSLGYEAVIVMLAGGILLAAPFALASYYLFYFLIVTFRKKRREKQILV